MKNAVPEYRVVYRRALNEENLLLGLEAPEISAQAQPGQFLNIQSNQFLRRPFGIARVDKRQGLVFVGVRLKGAGTRHFGDVDTGSLLSVLGPLGHGFDLGGGTLRRAFIIGGGTGLYPLLFLCESLREQGVESYLAGGFRSPEDAFLLPEFREAATRCSFASESGGLDVEGYAQKALEALWQEQGDASGRALFACGPVLLMRTAAQWAAGLGLPAQVSLEERMACGIGVCRGCATELRSPSPDASLPHYARCCMEGPVFPAEEVQWPI